MINSIKVFTRLSSFRTVLIYAIVSSIYIFSSDYILEKSFKDIDIISKIQTYKGIGFVIMTSILLFFLVKKNLENASTYFQEVLSVKQQSDLLANRSKEEYILLFNQSPLPMWLIDIETKNFVLVNEAACINYGYNLEEYLSMSLKDIRPPEDVPIMEEEFSKALNNGSFVISRIIRHQKKNGEIILVKIKSSVITFEGKKVRFASAVDVTAEMEVQEKLIETNSRLKLAGEIAGLGYWTNDLVKNKIIWSDEIYKIFELDKNTFELNIENIKELFHPDEHQNFNPNFYQIFDDETIKEVERRIQTKTGKIKWILERQYLIKDKNNTPIRLEGIAYDITNRKIHEQELWESNERFKILAKATVEAIIDWDIKNNKVFWGEGFHTLLGYDLSEPNNNLWSSNIHPEDRERVLNDLNRILEDEAKEYFISEYRFLKANGEVAFVQHKGILIRDKDGKVSRIVAAMIDLTEALSRLNKIERQNKALKEISWTQSHIVRAPLANIMGLIYLLKENNNKEVKDEKLIELIGDSAEKLDQIIREIVRKTIEIDEM